VIGVGPVVVIDMNRAANGFGGAILLCPQRESLADLSVSVLLGDRSNRP
jgi:hypothetical protein